MPNLALTKKQKLELLGKELAGYRDDPVGFSRNILGIDPHPGQAKWLVRTHWGLEPENALLGGNRFGKSMSAAIRLVHRAVYRIGWTREVEAAAKATGENWFAMNISITADQARIVHDRAYELLQKPKAVILLADDKDNPYTTTPFPRITLRNGAKIEARSSDKDGVKILGRSLDHVNFDEAAQQIRFKKLMDNVLRARMVDRKGIIDFTTTGAGRNEFGLYFLEGLEGKNQDLYCQVGSSFDNPYTNLERFAQIAQHMSPAMRAQNIDGAIIDPGSGFFNSEDLDAAHNEDLDEIAFIKYDPETEEVSHMELRPGGISWRARYLDHKYITGWDIADKKDYNVSYTFDLSMTPMVLVEFNRFHKKGWEFNFSEMRRLDAKYGVKSTKFDSTGIGDVATDMLKDIRAEGVKFTKDSKDNMLSNLQMLLSQRAVQWPHIQVMQNELRFYERDDAKLMTDCVMALAVACWFKRAKRFSFAGYF